MGFILYNAEKDTWRFSIYQQKWSLHFQCTAVTLDN